MLKRILSLRYHTIEPAGSGNLKKAERFYNVTPDEFKKQMSYLKDNGFETLTLSALLSIEDERDLPEKPVILTFDDGHVSHYRTALPVLKGLRFGGIFFIVVDDVGRKNHMSWKRVRELRAKGMEIGSHSLNHINLQHASYQELIFQLKASKKELEERLDERILAFSIPTGLYSHRISDVARGMGYKLVFTSFTGNITLYSNPHCLRRIGMRAEYTMDDFISIVEMDTGFLVKRRVEQFAKNRLKSAIGLKGYERIKKAVIEKEETGRDADEGGTSSGRTSSIELPKMQGAIHG